MEDNLNDKGGKSKPPIAAQILYALGFLGLIGGLLIAVLIFLSAGSSDSSGALDFIGLSSLSVQVAAIVLAAFVIGMFTLINFIRAKKKWALISYSVIIGVTFIATILEWLTRSEAEKLFSDDNPLQDFLVYIVVVPLLIILWTKNRKDFT